MIYLKDYPDILNELKDLVSNNILELNLGRIENSKLYNLLKDDNEISFKDSDLGPYEIYLASQIIVATPIEKIDLTDCNLKNQAIKVAKILYPSKTLQTLILAKCNLEESAIKVVEFLFQSQSLQIIDLSWNEIGEYSIYVVMALLESLSECKTLKTVILYGNSLAEEVITITDILKENTAKPFVYFEGYPSLTHYNENVPEVFTYHNIEVNINNALKQEMDALGINSDLFPEILGETTLNDFENIELYSVPI